MQRRDFVGQLALGSVLASSAAGQSPGPAGGNAPATPSKLVTTPLVLMAPRPEGVELVWGVSELCRGRIEWKSADGNSGEAATDEFGFVPQGTSILRVRLAELRPGEEYQLRSVTTSTVGARTETSEWKSFRTLNPAANDTRFVVWNDTHVNNATIQQLHERTPAADFLIWNGDTCNDWKAEELLIPTLLHPGGCDVTTGRPLFMVWGNHDVRGPWAFQLPSMVATPSGRPFYAFRSGPVAVICLHTGEDKPDQHPSFGGRVAFDALRREQAKWLARTIDEPAFRDAPYRIVFCHIPLRWHEERVPNYEAGGYDQFSGRSRAAWHDLLVSWKTQLVVSGHTHQHAWLPPSNEFPYGQLIGGGPAAAQATWMEGTANAESLTIRVRLLSGVEELKVSFPPLT